ncbi:hypothetical protein GRJ2_002451100 [Grus japonensis]|uniref:Uncharacterized protein n=1 Tax=Grus japonensis TaxID=30415 RepID=A0ABC9XTI2_GRUJA
MRLGFQCGAAAGDPGRPSLQNLMHPPSLLWGLTPASQDPSPVAGNEGVSCLSALDLACCRCVSLVERAGNRQ